MDVELSVPVTYSELKTLKDSSLLAAGCCYRITDYKTVTTQENTQSADHPFDIIVTALSENILSEKCSAVLRDGDTYFADSNLGGWTIYYTLDNDTSRFAWADAENGKGVIYRMIDENLNDCPYDFKNIQMRNPLDDADENYYYTFDGNGTDHSLNGNLCFNNVIGKYIATVQQINNIIFTNAKGLEVDNNFFDVKCYNNVFTKAQRNNRFERECYGNNFLGYNYTNTFSTKFRNNTVGAESQSMQFGQGATGNVIGANTYYCRFGNYFRYNNTCRYMYYSEFGHYVQYCNLSESAEVLEHHMRFLTFENNVQYVNLYKTNKTTNTYMENIKLCSGTVGKSASRIMIEVSELAQKYAITYANNSNGELVKYCDAGGGGSPINQVQSDWAQTDETKVDYIKNKPTITNGVDGKDGKDGYTPVKGVDYVDGKDGITPQLKIDSENYWCVSYDNGASWASLGVKAGATFDSVLSSSDIVHGNDQILLSNIINEYILNVDYSALAFDTTELVVNSELSKPSVLGQAILGQLVLA